MSCPIFFIFRINWSISAFGVYPASLFHFCIRVQFFINIKTFFNNEELKWVLLYFFTKLNWFYNLLRNRKTSLSLRLHQVLYAFKVNIFYIVLCLLTDGSLISFILSILLKKSFALCIISIIKKYKIFSINFPLC